MARTSKIEWTKSADGITESQPVEVKIDGESAGSFQKVRFVKDKEPKDLAAASKALGFKKESTAIRALLLGRNKLNATKARAQAKLNSLD